ncbi:hypothetical protein [Marinisporobacter balticus]|uniref:GDSL-like lipase/acylhydrolase family protein n=1 Tax=Marinisporobacter balticus TaxID=2018667 RepID=A0A4R2KH67_9FIRM|nr:hypothetical protein [Marinisporobacter balticus]TCO73151.1 hypothetical protein EV214_11653 [Marinisporobacter balticus]
MAQFKKVMIYFVIYALFLQLGLAYMIPTKAVYNERLSYDAVKDRPTNIEAVFEQVKKIIDEEKLKDYVVILGDSVGYSNPGPAESSFAYFLNGKAQKQSKHFRVFNLSMPAMQTGDIYTVLLKMKEYGISSDHVIINIVYAGFVRRNPDPPSVFWLKDQLKEIDEKTYNHVEKQLLGNKKVEENFIKKKFGKAKEYMYENVAIFKYKDYIQAYAIERFNKVRGKLLCREDIKPWFQKSFLKDLLKQPMYQRDFSDESFIMDETNLQIYFLDKIIALQKDKDTLVFLAAMNDELLEKNVSKPGFQENMNRIDLYFKDKPVEYINFNKKVDYNLFSDHVHLTPKGYQILSEKLWDVLIKWDID